ncbi:hypothetical protein, partial [Thioclava sp.]
MAIETLFIANRGEIAVR